MSDIKTEKISLDVSDGTQMGAYVSRPNDDKKHPGIMVIQEAFGVNHHIRDVADRFANLGYVAIAPEMFHRSAPGFERGYESFDPVLPHVKALTVPGIEADVRAAHNWLVNDSATKPDNLACIGYCLGGRAAYIANSALPLKAAISYYGGGIAEASLGDGGKIPGILDRVKDLNAPMLFFWGGLDNHIPPQQRRAVADALTEAGKSFVDVVFSKADHGFFCDERPSFNPQAASESWALVLAFLKNNMQ
ncbi:MAG TPA: dienelactone hydrolase family protein [Blastocatellia bacterium]|nr:dienelactone hydrolase family protein [Blastocatellia bacterium]